MELVNDKILLIPSLNNEKSKCGKFLNWTTYIQFFILPCLFVCFFAFMILKLPF